MACTPISFPFNPNFDLSLVHISTVWAVSWRIKGFRYVNRYSVVLQASALFVLGRHPVALSTPPPDLFKIQRAVQTLSSHFLCHTYLALPPNHEYALVHALRHLCYENRRLVCDPSPASALFIRTFIVRDSLYVLYMLCEYLMCRAPKLSALMSMVCTSGTGIG